MNDSVLIVPGVGNSGPEHWQTSWQAADPSMVRLQVEDWDRPTRVAWVDAIDAEAKRAGSSLVVVAHSLGCLAFVHWAVHAALTIRGALLVAVPDPRGSEFPRQAVGFDPVPMMKLPCASIVVFSDDDPYSSPQFARECAHAWSSMLVGIGRAGHINGASGLGGWQAGLTFLAQLRSNCS